jgi:5'-nucleotidase
MEGHMSKYQILLTNDDGIKSPGLWAGAEALSELGYVTVVAPREQSSGMGRSLPITSDGIIREERLQIKGQDWPVYAVGGTPAQAVLHGLLEVMPQRPDLVVSGINYGSNLGTGITISGTVGAAMEAAALGFRALAVSLETATEHHLTYSREVDFSGAAHFTLQFARQLLEKNPFPDVDLLKVDVPSDADSGTGWVLTRLARQSYYDPVAPERESWSVPGTVGYKEANPPKEEPPDSDVFVVRDSRLVSVTPISLDMTSRVDFRELEKHLGG